MRKHPHYGTANDNSFIGDIVRFIDQHAHLKPFEKDLLVNRITERYTGDSVEVEIAHLAMGIALPEMFATKFADELDAIPLGNAQEERQRAKLWMEDAGRYARNEAYWRDKRAYPAEECVRMLGRLLGFCGDFPGQLSGSPLLTLHDHVVSWGRPENPERYHQVSEQKVPEPNKPLAQQKFSVVQEFPGGPEPSRIGSLIQDDKKTGLYRKYNVTRTDGKPIVGECFVLQVSDPNTHPALLTWAKTVRLAGYWELANDVEELLRLSAVQIPATLNYLDELSSARKRIQSWLDKQGHDKCHYYPEIFRELAELFGLKPSVDSELPSLAEFKGGCTRFQAEQYPSEKHETSTVITDADVLKLIGYFKNVSEDGNCSAYADVLVAKMEAAIAENAKAGKPMAEVPRERVDFSVPHPPSAVLVDRERLNQLERIEDEQRVAQSFDAEVLRLIEVYQRACANESHLNMDETIAYLEKTIAERSQPSKPEAFSELLAAFKGGRLPLREIGRLFVAANKEGKVFTMASGPLNENQESGLPQLQIVQGDNGDYFVQHKSALWRIESNGVIGEGLETADSFRRVLAELGTPKGQSPTITAHVVLDRKRFDELEAAEDHLDKLHALGVDNWEGYVGPDRDKDTEGR